MTPVDALLTDPAALARWVSEARQYRARVWPPWKLFEDALALIEKLAEQRVVLCPVCGDVAHFKCGKCGEEFFNMTQSLAHSNVRYAPEVRALRAALTEAREAAQTAAATARRRGFGQDAIALLDDLVRRLTPSGDTP